MCDKWVGWVVLILGILFLLRDFNVWNFWNISWWTAMFVVGGVAVLWGGKYGVMKKKK